MSGLADIRRITIGQIDNKGVHTGGRGGIDNVFVRSRRMTVTDVFAKRTGKQHAFLGDITDPAGKFASRKLLDIGSIQQNSTRRRRVKSLQELEYGTLPATIAANESVNTACR